MHAPPFPQNRKHSRQSAAASWQNREDSRRSAAAREALRLWPRPLGWALLLIGSTSSCGARSTLENQGGSAAVGGMLETGGQSPTGGKPGSGGLVPSGGATGGVPAGGATTGGAGGTSTGGETTGGASAGGASSGGGGMGGEGGEDSSCDPAFDCRGVRSIYLLFSTWGIVPIRPEVARCVDYDEDESVDFRDYLVILQNWGQGCRMAGDLNPPGECKFPGRLVSKESQLCLTHEDVYALWAIDEGPARGRPACADVDDDGWVDSLDSATQLMFLRSTLCEGLSLDPEEFFADPKPQPHPCDGASIGDLNGDGLVDFQDLYGVLSQLRLDVTKENLCLDIDRNDVIDPTDVMFVLSRMEQTEAELNCRNAFEELEETLEKDKECTTDADCQIQDGECSPAIEHCSGAIYVNTSAEEDRLNELLTTTASCMERSRCRLCEEDAPPPVCNAGRCGPGP